MEYKKIDRRYLIAVGTLIKRYKSRRLRALDGIVSWEEEGVCPLCEIDYTIGAIYYNRCDSCPWVIIEGMSCTEANFEKDPFSDRIKRLEIWEKIINKQITGEKVWRTVGDNKVRATHVA